MASDYLKLQTICNKTYKEQAVWFLNCFWEDFASKEAELVWSYVLKNNELDLEHHEEGAGLDEMKAHVFLEKFDETLTVREMRDKLRSTGAIGETDRPKTVPLIHYLLYKYNADWHTLVDESRQGDNKEEMEKAEQLLKEVQEAFKESEAKAGAARRALIEAQKAESAATDRENEAKKREAEAKAAEEQAKQREAAAKASEEQAKQREAAAKSSAEEAKSREAQAQKDAAAAKVAEQDALTAQRELEAALQELKAQEDAYNQTKADLERKSEEGGVVSRNKAKAELAQHLAEDPLPLRRAKITQEAAVKKAERASQAAAQARQASEESAAASSKARSQAEADANQASIARQSAERDAAEATRARQAASQSREAASQSREAASQAREAASAAARASEQAKNAAEAALNAAARRLQDAEDYLEEVKKKPGQSYGQLWWIDRQLHEQKKYLPERKGGIRKH